MLKEVTRQMPDMYKVRRENERKLAEWGALERTCPHCRRQIWTKGDKCPLCKKNIK